MQGLLVVLRWRICCCERPSVYVTLSSVGGHRAIVKRLSRELFTLGDVDACVYVTSRSPLSVVVDKSCRC